MYYPYPPSSNTYSPPSNTYNSYVYIFYNPVAIWPQPLCNHGQMVAKEVKDVRDKVGMKNGMEGGGEKNLDVDNCVCCCLLLLFIINIK